MEKILFTSMICHLVVVPVDTRERRTTFFQGFSDFWFPDYTKILRALTFFPHDIFDPFLSVEDYIYARFFGGGLNIQFLRADLLEQYLTIFEEQNLMIWSTSLTLDRVERVINGHQEKYFHISTERAKGVTCLDDLDKDLAKKIILEMLSKKACQKEVQDLQKALETMDGAVSGATDVEARGA